MSLFHISRQYTMKKDVASSTLQNILDACETTSTSPIDDMLAQKITATKGYSPYITMVIIALIITLIAPIPFAVFSKASVQTNTSADIKAQDYNVKDGYLYLTVTGPFIDYTSIYAITSSGSMVFPLNYNTVNGEICFIYNEEEWNIYISDYNGDTVHFLLTPPQ